MSSLVFVVILAVWAVYLVQHWVRRRDHLATARSVDRFSEAMRVLERRRALPAPQPDTLPRSYASSPLRPARPARPEVVVKRAGGHGATPVAPSGDHRRSLAVARVRAGVLLAGSLAMVVLVVLAVSGALPRWTAPLGVGLCAVAVALVRWSVAQQQAARRRAPATVASRPAPVARAAAPRARRHTHDGHEFSAQSVAATLRTSPRREPGVVSAERRSTEPYDVHAVEASLDQSARVADRAAPVADQNAPVADQTAPAAMEPVSPPAEGTWEPVPVPPPTYTLKAKAYRPGPTGSVSLPADGTEMALAEEFEDLPEVHRVG